MKHFKKFMSLFVLILLFLSSCGKSAEVAEQEKILENPIVFNNPTDENSVKYYLDGDSEYELAIGGPYYSGKQKLDQPFFNEYRKLKEEKVEDIMNITNNIFDNSVKLKQELSSFKQAYTSLFSEILEENKDLVKVAKNSAGILIEYSIKEETLIAEYDEIKTDSSNEAINSYFKYNKTYVALKLANTVSEDYRVFVSIAAQTVVGLDDRENISSKLKKFDKKMDSINDLSDTLALLEKNQIILDTGLRQLETAEYYMSKGSISFIKDKIPNLKEKVDLLKNGKIASKEDIKFLESSLEFYDGISDSLSESLEDNFSKDRLFNVKVNQDDISYINTLFPQTHAGDASKAKGFFSKALSSIKYGAEKTLSFTKKTVKFSWKATKFAYKGTKTVVGLLAGAIDTEAKSGFDVAIGTYYQGKNIVYGNYKSGDMTKTLIDMKNNIYNNYNHFADNVIKGTAGSNLFKHSGEMLDGVEDGAAWLTRGAVEKTIGKGRISWGTSGLTKMTVGMFTGLGKGIYKIVNTKSTSGEVAEGYLDVGLSFIGGSKVLFKSSKVLSATTKIKGFKEMLKGGLVFIEKTAVKLKGQSIKGLSEAAIKKLGLVSGKIQILVAVNPKEEIKAILEKQLTNISKAVSDKIKELSERGLRDIISKSAGGLDEVKKSYKDFVEKAYEKSLKGYLKSLTGVVGGSADEYLDNLVGGEIDTLIKSAVKKAIDSGVIPGLSGPFDGEYQTAIIDEDVKEYLKDFVIYVVGNQLSATMKSSISEDEMSAIIDINLKGDIGENGNISNGKIQGEADITDKGKKYILKLNSNLVGNLTEDGGLLKSTNGKATDVDGFMGVIIKAVADKMSDSLGGEGKSESSGSSKGAVLDMEDFNIPLIKLSGE